ncbi:MAG: 1-deoxy-D-xylulose-5-phosphate synthase, partial [Muribaculaceae bacterium]|nr:1-deoxy-D-xylulose-5-phosphate synthase [Muribaculaceae bacterium]
SVSEAVSLVRSQGIDAAHYDAVFLKTLDDMMMQDVASVGKPVITVEDGTVEGGLGTAVSDWLRLNGFDLPVIKIGIPDRFIYHGTVQELYRQCGLDVDAMVRVIVNSVSASGVE